MRDYPVLRKDVNKIKAASQALSILALSSMGLSVALTGSAAIINLVDGNENDVNTLGIGGAGFGALYVASYAATMLSEAAKRNAEEELFISEHYVW